MRIRQIIDELAPGSGARSGKGNARYAQDIKGNDSLDVPQFDSSGAVVMQRWSDAPPTAQQQVAAPPQHHEVVHSIVATHDQS